MHEISLVQNLFEQLKILAKENRATKVSNVTMEIGPMSGVVIDSFRFGFDILAKEDTLFHEAELVVKVPPVNYTCTDCGHIETTDKMKPDGCPKCNELLLVPDGGDDLLLLQVEME